MPGVDKIIVSEEGVAELEGAKVIKMRPEETMD